MAGLKVELDEYLARKEDSKPLLKNSLPSVSLPKVGNWFRREQVEEDGWFAGTQNNCCPKMSKFQRIVGFCLCVCMGIFCFGLSALYIPVLLLKARKFALLYTMGSLFFMCSFSFLWGPLNHLRHLFSKERFWFTLSYCGTLTATLYCSLVLISTPLTLVCAVAQVIALLWFLVSYIPGGHSGMLFFTKLFTSSVSKTLPV
uniref:Vesicle transport protein n=1 Tax=Graphocephala atropunctata TaxID=36148 RepID=A0A1B6KXL4_9HEMI